MLERDKATEEVDAGGMIWGLQNDWLICKNLYELSVAA